MKNTDDLRIAEIRPLLAPAILLEDIPLTEDASATVSRTRGEIDAVLRGEDRRLVVICGPCSIHDVDAALEYGERLKQQASRLASDLLIVMRVYFEKPRTTVGWKGLINDPDLDNTFRINKGLKVARRLLADLAERGVPAGTEFLDTITPQFIADLVAWGAIGARTTESQVHRELASGLSMPVGFKNGTDGDVQLAVDAIRAALHPHCFLSVTKQGLSAIVRTRGNDSCHVILRGGRGGPNHDPKSVEEAFATLRAAGGRAPLMVDCSHGNSQKDHTRQALVADDVARQIEAGSRRVFGVMIESHLIGGRQDATPGAPLVRGQSITDACLGFDDTVKVLERLALASARARVPSAAG